MNNNHYRNEEDMGWTNAHQIVGLPLSRGVLPSFTCRGEKGWEYTIHSNITNRRHTLIHIRTASIKSKRVGDTNYRAIDYTADNLTHLVEDRTDCTVKLLSAFYPTLNAVVRASVSPTFLSVFTTRMNVYPTNTHANVSMSALTQKEVFYVPTDSGDCSFN